MTLKREISAALFDFDMTLVNSCDAIHYCTNLLAEHYGFREVSRDEILATIGLTIEDSWRAYWGDFQQSWVEYYRAQYRGVEMERLKPFDGVPEMLAELKRRGVKVGVVTNRRFAKMATDSVNLTGSLDAIVGLEQVKRAKPAPDPLFKGFELLGVSPERGVYVGDTDIDMQTAAAAGALGIGMTTGNFTADELIDAGAWRTADDISEVPDIITGAMDNGKARRA
jgi:HAD superfamily hydrolase (TIGR01509 family)